MSITELIEDLRKQRPDLCLIKYQSRQSDSSTFADVRDETHALFKCYDCLGYTNVCGDYKPIKNYVRNKNNG